MTFLVKGTSVFVNRILDLKTLWSSWKRPNTNGDKGDPVYLDFQKIFGKISDQRLSNELGSHRIRGKVVQE